MHFYPPPKRKMSEVLWGSEWLLVLLAGASLWGGSLLEDDRGLNNEAL